MDDVATATAGLVRWDQQQAKARLSEVIRRARTEGPQLVTTRGANPVVVVAEEDYRALVGRRPASFADLLLPGEDFEPARATAVAEYGPVDL